MLGEFRAIRQVFHALCDLTEGEDATELLEFAVRQEWMADLARRAASVARLDHTMPCEPETDDLRTTLWQLYAATRVRDALLLPYQPGPVDDSVRELDEALHREQPRCRPVPVVQTTQFFAAIGCRPVTEASFDPILHEIVTCEPAAGPGAPILERAGVVEGYAPNYDDRVAERCQQQTRPYLNFGSGVFEDQTANFDVDLLRIRNEPEYEPG
jgi:hypothetical protein